MVAVPRWLAASSAASSHGYWNSGLGGCNVSNVTIPLPSSQSALTSPVNLATSYIAMAFGVQNYTCSSANNYTSLGAVAELIDISCLYGTELFNTIQQPVYQAWVNTSSNVTLNEFINYLPSVVAGDLILGQHYYVPNPKGSGLSPKWDFTSSPRFWRNPEAYVIGLANGTLADPYNPQVDVPWVQLSNVIGNLATRIFRIYTDGGQPPASCTYGSSSNISVKFTAQYWFFGSFLQK